MEPNFPKDLHVMVNKFAFFFRKPVRGEVIMLDSPVDPSKGLIKRVIAVEGETLEIREKKVYIDGKKLDEPYTYFSHPETIYIGDNIPPVQVPEGTLFVMGDNRDNSADSRDWGFLDIEKVKGRAFIIYWSWDGSMPKWGWLGGVPLPDPRAILLHGIRWRRIGKLLP